QVSPSLRVSSQSIFKTPATFLRNGGVTLNWRRLKRVVNGRKWGLRFNLAPFLIRRPSTLKHRNRRDQPTEQQHRRPTAPTLSFYRIASMRLFGPIECAVTCRPRLTPWGFRVQTNRS